MKLTCTVILVLLNLKLGYSQVGYNLNVNVEDYDVFMVGETHGVAENYQVWIDTYTQLSKQHPVSIIGEVDYATSKYIDDAIKRNDTLLMREILLSFGSSPWRTEEKYQFYKYLAVNDFAGSFVGVDIPAAGLKYTEKYINGLIEKYSISNHTYTGVYESLISGDQVQIDVIFKIPITYNMTSVDSIDWSVIARNIVYRDRALSVPDSDWDRTRDKFIYDNYVSLIDHLVSDSIKFLGLWGLDHIYQRASNGVEWFSSLVAKHTDQRIYSVMLLYEDSQFLAPYYWVSRRKKTVSDFVVTNKFNDDKSIKIIRRALKKNGRETMDAGVVLKLPSNSMIRGSSGQLADYISEIRIISGSKPMTELIDN